MGSRSYLEGWMAGVLLLLNASTAAARQAPAGNAPYPPSPVIAGVHWAPVGQIIRRAAGSDNWPITWADDGQLYCAYGDGWGFEPKLDKKLSLGLASVAGVPPHLTARNIRSSSLEQLGQGPAGKKASGILMVHGVLYLWVRNAGNAQLAWSYDRGLTWSWAPWRFEVSFGAPTFLNFGRDYQGARDRFVYIYSPDTASAYLPADRMVLARVPKDQLTDRAQYQFLAAITKGGGPRWTAAIAERGAAFEFPGHCYRSGISFNHGLQRYLWCQTLPCSKDARGPRFQGGFGIYDAPEPWGPWTTVSFIKDWDVGPGETSRFPTKWMSPDGSTAYLVFSGDDHFSLRKCEFRLRKDLGPQPHKP